MLKTFVSNQHTATVFGLYQNFNKLNIKSWLVDNSSKLTEQLKINDIFTIYLIRNRVVRIKFINVTHKRNSGMTLQ